MRRGVTHCSGGQQRRASSFGSSLPQVLHMVRASLTAPAGAWVQQNWRPEAASRQR